MSTTPWFEAYEADANPPEMHTRVHDAADKASWC